MSKIGGWVGKIPYSHAGAIAVGVTLLAVPTFFTVVPGWTNWDGKFRTLILVGWVAIAGLTVAAAVERDKVIQRIAEDRKAHLRQLRWTATNELMDALLRRGAHGIPEHYEFTVYLFDGEQLAPIWPYIEFHGDPDPRVFSPGHGATGTAWERRRMVVVTGSEVASGAYGLSKNQQDFFRDYKTAVATPIWEEATRPFGVLTALGREDDHSFSGSSSPGRSSLMLLADVVGVMLARVPEAEDLSSEGVTPLWEGGSHD